ncbi:PEP-CTERM sorting domain-containing protein [Nodularia harveyana UHCC-0300]|uniref:PEP-CTERM sorting domain-containing protein n=1 Tax=Nodularia harveyana UHCC-0300 TaxID=2974287 RepID=A0ABU5UEW2_9CYAN|nr:PEP-CTERM sorting domain-containing protein [Nodularia harveyana]MEA5581709.1 PEP-CTERM sorting domain-containing protein [Nodularia harveyana UHCC-0300]
MTKHSITNISKILAFGLSATAVSVMSAQSASAAAFTTDVGFTQLTGSINTGANTSDIGIFRADFSTLGGDISSILLRDSGNLAGATSQFSGFDLDSIILSTTLINDASQINTVSGLGVFDFTPAGTVLTPGTQRAPADPALFGTSGGNIDNTVATLGSFDGNLFDTVGNGDPADFVGSGFASLGDNGEVLFNLTSAVSAAGPLYLYVGDVGNNGESLGQVTVSGQHNVVTPPTSVPEPATLAALSLMGVYFASRRKQAAKTV